MIGRSLSFCVKEIAEGKVALEDVEFIVSSTRMENDMDFYEVTKIYHDCYWNFSSISEKCFIIALELWVTGKIYQPRLFDDSLSQNLANQKIWVNDISECVYV